MLTVDQANDLFIYDAASGLLRMKVSRKGVPKGRVVGFHRNDGYVEMVVDKQKYVAHRVIWFMHHGLWPEYIDHINGNKSDNRIENLRNVSRAQNNKNSALRSHSRVGLKGVIRHKGASTYYARVIVDGKRIASKSFRTAEAAHEEYKRMAAEHFGEFAVTENHRLVRSA